MNAGGTAPENASRSTESRLAALEAILPTLATKADLAELRTEVREGFANLRTEFTQDIAALRSEMHEGFAALRAEMAQLRDAQFKAYHNLLMWVVSTMIGLGLAFLGATLAIVNMAITVSRSTPAHSATAAPSAAVMLVVPPTRIELVSHA